MTRTEIALKMLTGRLDIIHANEDIQADFICKALSFADLFYNISDGHETQIIIKELQEGKK